MDITMTAETYTIITTGIVAVALFSAARRYNTWITAIEARAYHAGYVSLLVAAGVAAVLLGALIAVWPLGPTARIAVAITAGLFAPAGAPMIIGSIHRHVAARNATETAILTEARHQLASRPDDHA